jgi:hypothetical protein
MRPNELYNKGTKGGRVPLPRAHPHQLGEAICGFGGPGDGLIAFGATIYRYAFACVSSIGGL